MKNTFFYSCILISTIILFTACKKEDQQTVVPPLNDNSLPSAAVAKIQVLNKSGANISFAVDLTIFRDSKNMETQLNTSNFPNDTVKISSSSIYYLTPTSVSFQGSNSGTAFSSVMLMDQSGSIASTDPYNYRISAAKAFCRNLGTGDNVSVWSFEETNILQYGKTFTSDTSVLIPYISALAGWTGGGTPLYKAQNQVINYVASSGTSSNKAVMTFTDGEDTYGGFTTTQISDNAIAKNVKLYNIGLGSAETASLCTQAVKTGGAFMFAKDARQLISMFGNLGKMLENTAGYYHTVWTLTAKTGNFGTGTLTVNIVVNLPYGGSLTIPLTISY